MARKDTMLFIRTDAPECEVELRQEGKVVASKKWLAGRDLSQQLLKVILDQLSDAKAQPSQLSGVVFYEGPGSFTGLRIGASVANAFSQALDIKCVAAGGEDWSLKGTKMLEQGSGKSFVVPVYGSLPNITKPRK